MTSSNHSKLLVLDVNYNHTSLSDLHAHFSSYGTIESIERYSNTKSAVLTFANALPVDNLIASRSCLIKQNHLRLRRCRLDPSNWHLDSQTLLIKLSPPIYPTSLLTETTIFECFRNYRTGIQRIDLIDHNQAFVSFLNYDLVDQILLAPMGAFVINAVPLVFERMMAKIPKRSRWDQAPAPLLSDRDPVVYKLISHIEHLSKQLREQPSHLRDHIERLEVEVFILKNENAKLKSKENLPTGRNLEQRLTALEDLSNRYLSSKNGGRERSESHEKHCKRRRRQYPNENDY